MTYHHNLVNIISCSSFYRGRKLDDEFICRWRQNNNYSVHGVYVIVSGQPSRISERSIGQHRLKIKKMKAERRKHATKYGLACLTSVTCSCTVYRYTMKLLKLQKLKLNQTIKTHSWVPVKPISAGQHTNLLVPSEEKCIWFSTFDIWPATNWTFFNMTSTFLLASNLRHTNRVCIVALLQTLNPFFSYILEFIKSWTNTSVSLISLQPWCWHIL